MSRLKQVFALGTAPTLVKLIWSVVLVGGIVLAPVGARAEEGDPVDVWVEPYAWVPLTVSGDVRVGDETREVEADLGDLLGVLKFAAMLRTELWMGPVGLVLDGMYARTGSEGPAGLADVTVTQFVGDALAGVRLFRHQPVSLELLAGARAARIEATIETPEQELSEDAWTASALAGARVPFRLSDRWTFEARGQIKVPDFSWRLEGVFEAKLTGLVLATFGYRYAALNYDEDRVEVDLSSHGPYLGIAFAW